MAFIIIGILAVLASPILSRQYIDRKLPGLPAELTRDVAGRGIVPSWVSTINLVGWGLIVLGVLSFLVKREACSLTSACSRRRAGTAWSSAASRSPAAADAGR